MTSEKIIFIVGPTSVGKSQIAVHLARKINGEIISCDSMQIYKEISIASNKPTPDEQKSIKHHMIDMVPVSCEFDVAEYNKLVNEAIQNLFKKKKIPVIVGGSGLYMQILLDGLFEGAGKNDELRNQLELEAEANGNKFLHEKLEQVDPQAAAKIHPNDRRRIIRALEIFITENQPIDAVRQKRSGLWGKYDVRVYGLNREREELYDRINTRVETMFQEGIEKEIKRIYKKELSNTAGQLIGLEEVGGYIDGQYPLEQAKYLMKLNTRHFAKRQMTWLRKESRLTWVDVQPGESAEATAGRILTLIQK